MDAETKPNSEKDVIIVTGGNGFIGSAIISRLSKSYRMVCLDNEDSKIASESIQVNIASEASINAAMDQIRSGYGNKIASVIHLVAYYDFAGKPSPLYEESLL